jgi:hypothetical protein
LFAFSATTGALVWSQPAPTGVPSGFPWDGAPAVANGIVYENASGAELSAFNAITGAPVWSSVAYGGSVGGSAPVVANGVVYLGTGAGLFAFNSAIGTRLWSSRTTGSPVIANGMLITSSEDIEAYSLPVQGAALTVFPTFVPDFGTVLDGTRAMLGGSNDLVSYPLSITNFGNTATTVTADLVGANPSQFPITSNDCTATALAPGAWCTIAVNFAPTLPGTLTATLAVHTANGTTASADLSGTGNPLTIDPSGWDYGPVADRTSSPATTFTVTNRSTATVTTSGASFTGSQFDPLFRPDLFDQNITDTCAGATLSPDAACTIAVAFTPGDTDYGIAHADLSVTGTPGVTITASLSGIAVPYAITPATKDFGTVRVGSNARATFTITNTTTAALPAALAPSTVAGQGFSLTTDGCNGQDLAAGATCKIVVTFTPTAAGASYNGQLTVPSYFIFNQASLSGTGG